MTNLFSTSLIRNIYKKPSKKSEITSQIIYGEKIKIIKNKNRKKYTCLRANDTLLPRRRRRRFFWAFSLCAAGVDFLGLWRPCVRPRRPPSPAPLHTPRSRRGSHKSPFKLMRASGIGPSIWFAAPASS